MSGRREKKTSVEGRNMRENVSLFQRGGTIMVSLCLVKRHEIAGVTVSMYSAP